MVTTRSEIMEYTVQEQDGWFWCRWWFMGRWHGTLLYQTEVKAEQVAFDKMNAMGVWQ